jgi:propionyl-CoA carboxylase alpha chain
MKKILVANRGEIAMRVMRSIRQLGLLSVAVYSEADKDAPFVKYADEAVLLGPPPSNESYLLADKIIEVAKQLGVDGIHPGYGFLSENAEFAEKVEAEGITFIGPSTEAIRIMGDKLAAKQAVKKFDIPMVPGTDTAIDDIAEAKRLAGEIGYPILVKASAGGGGKGMRVVEKAEDFEEQLTMAMNEAQSAFGNNAVFIERYVQKPRHIEIQIMADKHGNIVYLFERECSIQRRHQKVIEEAPSSLLTPELREAMGQAAVNVARSVDYVGAGTVEFLMDENKNFYFLEMNTRLQVEHPVTEMITGVDLVQEQIRVAEGEPLSFTQSDLTINGHAIEVRVYAEDPANNFLPGIGKLYIYRQPQGEGVRVDDGFEEGMEIPIYYDPMISKLIVHGNDRAEAIERMKKAIREYHILGITTTLPFGHYVMNHEAFVSGDFDTQFVTKHYDAKKLHEAEQDNMIVAALGAGYFLNDEETKYGEYNKTQNQPFSPWLEQRKR